MWRCGHSQASQLFSAVVSSNQVPFTPTSKQISLSGPICTHRTPGLPMWFWQSDTAFEAVQLLLSACVHVECSHPSRWKKNKYVSSFITTVLTNITWNKEAGIVLGAHVRSSICHQLKCSPLGFLSKKHISPNYNKWQLSLLHWPSLATLRRWGRNGKQRPALCHCTGFRYCYV